MLLISAEVKIYDCRFQYGLCRREHSVKCLVLCRIIVFCMKGVVLVLVGLALYIVR